MKRGKFVRVLWTVLLAASLLSACGGGSGSPAGNGGGAAGEETAGVRSSAPPGESAAAESGTGKDQVVIGFTEVPSNYDPLNGFSYGVQILYSALVQTDKEMNVIPDLAEYAISEDALTYTFTLRDDVKFSDGSPLTAQDVVFSFETARDNVTNIDLSMMEDITADGQTVTITLTHPLSTFIITVASVGIVPRAAYGEDFPTHPIGSGPYRLAQYDVDQQFILEANDYYYGEAPGIRRVIFLKMADEDTRLLAARSGQVDITLTSAAIAAGMEIDGYRLLAEETVDNMGFVMPVVPDTGEINQYGSPVGNNVTCDIALRKALAYGIDRQRICEEALNGYATPSYSENDGMPWSNPESVIDYDLDYAVSLLEGAGWVDADGDGVREKDGLRAAFPLMYFAGDSVRQAVAMALSNQALENLGIEITVEGVGEDETNRRMYSDPMILAWGSANPMTSYMLFHSSNAGKDDWYNPENYTNGTVDFYLDAARNAASMEDAIPYWRKAQWDGETGTSMRGDAPYIFLLNKTHLYWVQDGLDTGAQKIHAHGDSWPLVANLREWKWD